MCCNSRLCMFGCEFVNKSGLLVMWMNDDGWIDGWLFIAFGLFVFMECVVGLLVRNGSVISVLFCYGVIFSCDSRRLCGCV